MSGMIEYSDVVLYRGPETPVVGAEIGVYLVGTETKATLYNVSLEVIDNPTLTNSLGIFDFWTAPGIYDLWVNGVKNTTISLQEALGLLEVPDDADGKTRVWRTHNGTAYLSEI